MRVGRLVVLLKLLVAAGNTAVWQNSGSSQQELRLASALLGIEANCHELAQNSFWQDLRQFDRGFPSFETVASHDQGQLGFGSASALEALEYACRHLDVGSSLSKFASKQKIPSEITDQLSSNPAITLAKESTTTDASDDAGWTDVLEALTFFVELHVASQLVILVIISLLSVWVFEMFVVRSSLFRLRAASGGPVGKGSLQNFNTMTYVSEQPRRGVPETLRREFWRQVASSVHQSADQPESHCGKDYVGFAQREFSVDSSQPLARVLLHRHGNCDAVLAVSLSAFEDEPSGLKAKANTDFEARSAIVRFEPKQREAEFCIPIQQTERNDAWAPTRWFYVRIDEVLEGTAAFGGPMVTHWDAGLTGISNPCARVCIVNRALFPFSYVDSGHRDIGPFLLAHAYIKDCKRHRGTKFGKTMFGMLYSPFHEIVVVTLAQKYVIDWSIEYEHGTRNVYVMKVFGVGAVLLISAFLLRWANVLQVTNRGRTGGIRQHHRWQILSKLLMLDHRERLELSGSRTFYTAIQNVETMTLDGYWQAFVIAQSLASLVLSVLVLMFSNWNGGRTVGLCALILPLPLTYVWIARRRPQTFDSLERRMNGEYHWVETLSMASHSENKLYCLGPRELAQIEKRFSTQSAAFVKDHQCTLHNYLQGFIAEALSTDTLSKKHARRFGNAGRPACPAPPHASLHFLYVLLTLSVSKVKLEACYGRFLGNRSLFF
eukprot:TRINITY_DN13784_c0_g1_i6.p1 TRINITY_DN13784_c0_g1~~TRINITY_DN13784_c0_g1_i6.p1  ORF type:complete len:719 (-),score=53.95 TRINITY_DN13784_c0_g1_i6:108-2264(-)